MEIVRNKNILFELTRNQIKTQYRDSTLGFVWTFLNPLLNMLVMWVVFKAVLNITDPYYPIYILSGNIVFAALRASTSQSLQSMVSNRNLLLRTKIDFSVFPLSNVFASIVNFGFSLIALIPFMLWLTFKYGVNLFSYQIPFMLLMLPALLIFEYGLGLLLSIMFVFFRDLKHLYGVFLTLWQYLTPLFYPIDRVNKESLAFKLIRLNPMFHFVNYFRDCVYRGATGVTVLGEHVGPFLPSWWTLFVVYCFAAGMLAIGYVTFRLLRHKIITRI